MADDAAIARTVETQRDIQDQVARADEQGGAQGKGAVQAGARPYPEPPLPRQHRMSPLPGRGYLICDGTIEGVHLVLAVPGEFSNERGSAELHRSLDDRTSHHP